MSVMNFSETFPYSVKEGYKERGWHSKEDGGSLRKESRRLLTYFMVRDVCE